MESSSHPVALVVVDEEGKERPGSVLRAGDFIECTEYDHARRVMTAHAVPKQPLPLRLRLRRWWEGRRGDPKVATRRQG